MKAAPPAAYISPMRHPFEKLSPAAQRAAYWGALAITLLLAGVLQSMAAPFAGSKPGEPTRYNILHFEFAGDVATAKAIVDSWGADGQAQALKQTLVDYLFLLSYPQAIALGILAVLKNARSAMLWKAGRWLAWLQWLAGLLDAVENAALIGILKGHVASPLPEIAFWCAAPKFAIVVSGIVFVLAGVGLAYTRGADSVRGLG